MVKNYQEWIERIKTNKLSLSDATTSFQAQLQVEFESKGIETILNHLNFCEQMPEDLNSKQEKLFAKYTDIILSQTFSFLGLNSSVLTERSDAADVKVSTTTFSFVADAKTFRLSRTAKNEKDFKVSQMNQWKGDCDYAIVVCPDKQLPTQRSQIYEQSITSKKVCILTYSHLRALVRISEIETKEKAVLILHEVLKKISTMSENSSAKNYWFHIDSTFKSYLKEAEEFLYQRTQDEVNFDQYVKEESLNYYKNEAKRIDSLSKSELIAEVKKMRGLENKINTINLW